MFNEVMREIFGFDICRNRQRFRNILAYAYYVKMGWEKYRRFSTDLPDRLASGVRIGGDENLET
ncbi:MAG: hypothetical protein DMG76_34005 [Acidobacteria bacterium]|nr:MAG: hypothetical protein DMG76_34005 [Acidobacteriota bacterium]